jgi:hypothetical protein
MFMSAVSAVAGCCLVGGIIVLVGSVLGGCAVGTGSPERDSTSRVHDAVIDDQAHLDLREPPGPEDLGVEPGRDSVSYGRSSGDVTIDVDLRLPADGRLHVPAIALHAAFSDIIGNEIVVNRVEPSLDDAERVVLADAEALGLDAASVREVVADWRRAETDGGFRLPGYVFRGRQFGYLGLEVEMRPNEPNGTVLINYTLSWSTSTDASTPTTSASGP